MQSFLEHEAESESQSNAVDELQARFDALEIKLSEKQIALQKATAQIESLVSLHLLDYT